MSIFDEDEDEPFWVPSDDIEHFEIPDIDDFEEPDEEYKFNPSRNEV